MAELIDRHIDAVCALAAQAQEGAHIQEEQGRALKQALMAGDMEAAQPRARGHVGTASTAL